MNRITLAYLVISTFFVFSACSDKEENQPKGSKFYLKEAYVNSSLISTFEYDLKERRVIKESKSNSSDNYTTWEYPSKDKAVSKDFPDNGTVRTVTYTLNDKNIATESVEENTGRVNKIVKKNIYTFDAEGFLVRTNSITTFIWFDPYYESISHSETINKIENGNIVETKIISNDTTEWTSKFTFSADLTSGYTHKNEIFGKTNTNQIAGHTFSGFVEGLGKIKSTESYLNYVINANGLVESYSVSGDSYINGVEQPKYITHYKSVYGKF